MKEDKKEAFRLYEKAAVQEHAPSQNQLGYRYQKGIGTTKDLQQAFSWCSKAAE